MADVIILNENMYIGNNTELVMKISNDRTVLDIEPVAIQAGRGQSTFNASYLM
jgi:hypothetical protein